MGDPDFYRKTAGKPSAPWSDWIEHFESYLKIKKIINEDERLENLKYFLGIEGKKILKSLNAADNYKATVEALTQHLGEYANTKYMILGVVQTFIKVGEIILF